MYHKVDLDSPTMWWVTVDAFYKQMFELRGKNVVYLDDYNPADESHIVITFDGVYKNILTYAAPIMQKFGYCFELFITSDYLDKANDFDSVEPAAEFASVDQLKELEELGGRVQWHTQSHPDMKNITDASVIEKELSIPSHLKVFGDNSLQWFAYPYGNFNESTKDGVRKAFKGAVSCNQGSDTDKYAYNRLTVTNETRLGKATITCIIPCYNYGHFLSEAVESALRQTITPDEIIIADDHSTDATEEVALFFKKQHPNIIKYVRNEKNLGIIGNFNKAVKMSSGTYVVFLGADNRFQSDYIEECAGILNEEPEVGIAYTDFLFFGPRARKMYDDFPEHLRSIVKNDYYKIQFPEGDIPNLLDALSERNFVHGSSMFRRECFDKVGGYTKDANRPEDYNLFLRIIRSGYKIKKAGKTLLQYRQHSTDQANHTFGTQALVNIYMRKAHELEKELNTLRRYKVVAAISLGFKLKNNTKKAYRYLKEYGLVRTVKRIIR